MGDLMKRIEMQTCEKNNLTLNNGHDQTESKIDITPETLYNLSKLVEQCAPLLSLLENHKTDPSDVL